MVEYEHWPEARVLRRIRLSEEHLPTGQAKQYSNNELLPPPREIVIARHDSISRHSLTEPPQPYASYYLFYLDSSGAEMSDLCEQSLADALALAEATLGIQPEEWEVVDDDEP